MLMTPPLGPSVGVGYPVPAGISLSVIRQYVLPSSRRGPHDPLLPDGGSSYRSVLTFRVGDHADAPAALTAATRK